MVAVRAWIFALLATLLVILPNGASVRAEHFCKMTGRIVASCCCDDEVAAAPPGASQQVQVEDCCQRVSSPSRSASLGVDKAARALPGPALAVRVFALPSVEPSACTSSRCTESTQAPLAIGPPLFVKHCALLS